MALNQMYFQHLLQILNINYFTVADLGKLLLAYETELKESLFKITGDPQMRTAEI